MALTGVTNEEKIWNYLRAQGFNDFGAAGLMGNLYAESGLKPTNLQNTYEKSLGFTDDGYTAAVDNSSYTNFVHDSAGYGLAQWTYYSRKQNLLNYAKSIGTSIGDLEMQLQFLVKELNGYSGMSQNLKNATSVLNASNWVLLNFERPADQGTSVQNKRASFGQTYYDKFAGKTTTTEKGATNMSAVERLIATARAEVGYLEKATNSNLDDKTANAGNNNWTKYARDLDNLGNIYNGKKNGYAWCDMFVDWCFIKTFGVELAMKLLCQAYNGAGAGCTYSAQYYKNKGQFYKSNPKPGDQIFFTNDGGASSSHTGIVVAVDSSRVYTIEGNTSSATGVVANGGCVREKSYSLSYANIYGYGRPDWLLAGDSVSSTTPAISTTYPTIKSGSSGSYVKLLQESLIALGYNVGSSGAVGEFGNATLEAVKQFQKNNKLTVDGVVGSQTWTALKTNPIANDKAVNYQGKVVANGGLNCRTDPVDGSVITAYPNGAVVTIIKERNGWGYTGTGWVSLDYIQKITQTATVQPQVQKEDDDVLSFEDWKKYMEQYRKELQDNDCGSWSEAARQWAISTGMITGMGTGADGKPNYAWADQLTREQAAALFYRFAQMMGKV